MTRVEKYRRYREEIANMKFESLSNKKETSIKLENIRENSNSSSIEFDKVMDLYEIYDTNAHNTKRKIQIKLRRDQIYYCIIAFTVIALLLVAVIVIGTKLWG